MVRRGHVLSGDGQGIHVRLGDGHISLAIMCTITIHHLIHSI